MDVQIDEEEVETKLDLEFRGILRIIKIYVPCIRNVDYLNSYRSWLEKLSEAGTTDKQQRNRYLIELCRQIRDGILEKPFRKYPVPGPLPPLKRNLSNKKEQLQRQQQQQQRQEQSLQQHHQQRQKQQHQEQLLQLQQQQLQQQQMQQQQLLQLQQQHVQEQKQLQMRHFSADVIPVKQESVHNTISKEQNRANKPSMLNQEVQTLQDDSEYHNYFKGFPKSPHIVQRDVQVTKDNVHKPNLLVVKNPSTLELSNISHKKRNQYTVLKKIQEHIRNSNTCKEQTTVFPEATEQSSTHTEVPLNYVNAGQRIETQQRYNVPSNCYLQENQQQNVPYQQQESQPPPSVHMKKSDSFSKTQELLKNTSQHQNVTSINIKINNEDIEEEENSWYDMSDASRTATLSKMESGDSANSLIPLISHLNESNNNINPSKIHETCESKIKELINVVAELKTQNLSLNAKAEVIIQNLSDEVNLLKVKEQKLNEMKVASKKTNSLASTQWKNTITDLKQTLHNAQNEIATLQDEIVGLKEKLEEFSSQKQQDNITIRQRLADMYDKEIEMLKQNYVRHIMNIENKFTQILIEKEAAFNQKLNDLKELYDRKISDITKGISEIAKERCNERPVKVLGRNNVGKQTIISKYVSEKEPLETTQENVDDKRRRLAIGSYKLNPRRT